MQVQNIKIEDYTYELPDQKIAKYPLVNRNLSKLLLYNGGKISTSVFDTIEDYLENEAHLIFNNTKVIQARLLFYKESGARIEVFCLEPHEPNEYNLSFQQNESCSWKCMIGNLKRWKTGKLSQEIEINKNKITFSAEITERQDNAIIIKFSWNNNEFTFSQILERIGETPIPPYLNRKAEDSDKTTYQTVYSKIEGSVAAPTAGLHFTNEKLRTLEAKGVKFSELTLHVGAGTFQPVKSEEIGNHPMHEEQFFITKQLLENLLDSYGKNIAVGTTSLRTLESIFWLGNQITNNTFNVKKPFVKQWEPYESKHPVGTKIAIKAILEYMNNQEISVLQAVTKIIIVPGYDFKIVKGLITNFHQPQSTLLLLVAALTGNNWKKIYDYALSNNFRFLSYGDSSLILP